MQLVQVKGKDNVDFSVWHPTILNATLYTELQTNNLSVHLCRLTIGSSYIKECLVAADYLWVVQGDDKLIKGFICVETRRTNSNSYYLEVTLLCASPQANAAGKLLMQKVIAFAKENNSLPIMLNAVPHKVSYYRKFGFLVGKDCDTTDSQLTDKSEFYNYIRGKKTNDKIQFATLAEMVKNQDAQAFLKETAAKKFMKVLSTDCLSRIANSSFGKGTLERCIGEGITMYLCFKPKTPSPPPNPKTKTRSESPKRKTPSVSPKMKTLYVSPKKAKTKAKTKTKTKTKAKTTKAKAKAKTTKAKAKAKAKTTKAKAKAKTTKAQAKTKAKTKAKTTKAKTKTTRKKRTLKTCIQRNKDTNPFTKKCTAKCKNLKIRRERDFRCVTNPAKSQAMRRRSTCEQRNKETNPFTKKCTPKCKGQKVRRERDFRCVKKKV